MSFSPLSFTPSAIDESAYYDELILESDKRASLSIVDKTNPPGLGNINKLTLAYNPEALNIARTVTWSSQETDGNNTQLAFGGGGEYTIDVPVLLDGSEWEEEGGGSILKYIQYLNALTEPYDHEGKYQPKDIRPAVVSLVMKDLLFVGVVTGVKTNIEMFSATGSPMRAVVTVSLKGLLGGENQKAKALADILMGPKEKPDKGKGGSTDAGDKIAENSE